MVADAHATPVRRDQPVQLDSEVTPNSMTVKGEVGKAIVRLRRGAVWDSAPRVEWDAQRVDHTGAVFELEQTGYTIMNGDLVAKMVGSTRVDGVTMSKTQSLSTSVKYYVEPRTPP